MSLSVNEQQTYGWHFYEKKSTEKIQTLKDRRLSDQEPFHWPVPPIWPIHVLEKKKIEFNPFDNKLVVVVYKAKFSTIQRFNDSTIQRFNKMQDPEQKTKDFTPWLKQVILLFFVILRSWIKNVFNKEVLQKF